MTTRSSLRDPDWLVELRGLLLAGEPMETFVEKVARRAKESVPDADSCGVRIRYDKRTLTSVTEAALRALESDQGDLAEGPGPTALEDGEPRYLADLCQDERWPVFCRRACATGFRSLLVTVLTVPERQRIGTLTFWSRQVDAFGGQASEAAHRFAGGAGLAVGMALAFALQAEVAQDLHRALATRSVIDQALGVIMAEDRCGPEQAFETLRRASMNRNIKVHSLAGDIVRGVSGRPPPDPPFASRTFSG